MPRNTFPQPDPEHVQYAADEMAKGRSSREVVKDFAALGVSVSHMTVARWSAKINGPKPAVPPKPKPARVAPAATVAHRVQRPNPLAAELAQRKADAAAQAPPTPAVDTTDTLGTLRGLLESFMAEAHRSREGNPRLATTLAKSAADVLDQIRKIEARQADDQSQLRISRDEIAKAKQAALERFKALCDRPLLCSACGRALAIAWGEAGEKVAEAMKSEGA